MARRRRNNLDNKGRNRTTRFARLDHRMLNSNAYRALTPNARSLLVELIMLHNGENNGSLYLSVRDAAHRLGVADTAAATNAFAELINLGFIEMTKDSYFAVKANESSRARCWRLTWEVGPGKKVPDWRFLERQPDPDSLAYLRMERGLKVLKAHHFFKDLRHL
ncbi:MAG: hypothetical protein K2Q27_11570 [Novosphingobium sp.]|nr:hypothetical protein [Novosphingobium sp.]